MMDTGIADFKKCHAGEKEMCCAYLILNADGFQCARGTSMQATIQAKTKSPEWTAKRLPVKPFPECYDDSYLGDPRTKGTT
jgi:hypothetical protein